VSVVQALAQTPHGVATAALDVRRAGAAVSGHDACDVHHDARGVLDASAQ
jgi:hypothetical protein